jgi:hypothetical protein
VRKTDGEFLKKINTSLDKLKGQRDDDFDFRQIRHRMEISSKQGGIAKRIPPPTCGDAADYAGACHRAGHFEPDPLG